MFPEIVAIINITPDSFSDGGSFAGTEAILATIQTYAAQGAAVIDIGAESTRPGATALTPEEEWQRLEPVLNALPPMKAKISIDTRHAEVARKALTYKVDWINDVSGFSDPAMLAAVKDSDCKLLTMHSLSVPADSRVIMPESADVVEELLSFARKRIDAMQQAGIARERIIFDPGIGFGKSPAQSLEIVRNIERFAELGVPLLVGHSRKSFLGGKVSERDVATLTVSGYLAQRGVAYVRVHDVISHVRMFAMLERLNHG